VPKKTFSLTLKYFVANVRSVAVRRVMCSEPRQYKRSVKSRSKKITFGICQEWRARLCERVFLL
jgi:hypothetical protein